MEAQARTDLETLRRVIPALEELESEWNEARVSVAARARGYFTPDEDDRVRQMLLAYRNYRFALYEIIYRAYAYAETVERERQLTLFLLGFGAALTLYSKSLKLIQAYEREPLVRKKLNEPDPKSELEPDFFEELLESYSSLGNYAGLIKAAWFWRSHRRDIQKFAAASPEGWKWLLPIIRGELLVVRQRLMKVLACRLRYDWRAFVRTVLRPVRTTRYNLRSQIAGACAGIRTTRHYVPALNQDILTQLRPQLQPGDFLLIRAEQKLTSAILPGFWAHAALFVGGAQDLEALGISRQPKVAELFTEIVKRDEGHGCVIEGISPAVQISSLEFCLCADHVAVLRPRLSRDQLRPIVSEAFRFVGTPYDFEFDFNLSTRVVCTGLIYRCFHKRGGCEFKLIKRLGRYTLSGDDIMNQWVAALDSSSDSSAMPFDLVALVLKNTSGKAHFVPITEVEETMRRIQKGWRPTREAIVRDVPVASARQNIAGSGIE
jgi:hypothetical protein